MSLYGIYAQIPKEYKVKKSLPEGLTVIGIPQCTCKGTGRKRGSLTVEAAMILPLLVCLFSFLLFYFQIMQIQLSVQTALEKTGRNLALLSSVEMGEAVEEIQQSGTQAESGQEILYFSLAKASVYAELKENKKIERYVSGGVMGISLLASETEGDFITLEANYGIQFPVNLLGKKIFLLNQRASFRKWTGWHLLDVDEADTILVYVTENGTVYHQRTSCPYLSLSIRKVSSRLIKWLRNKNGGIYRECERCGKESTIETMVYITDYGDRYHYAIDCSGLKRTIYQKRLSEVEGKSPCSKCWK